MPKVKVLSTLFILKIYLRWTQASLNLRGQGHWFAEFLLPILQWRLRLLVNLLFCDNCCNNLKVKWLNVFSMQNTIYSEQIKSCCLVSFEGVIVVRQLSLNKIDILISFFLEYLLEFFNSCVQTLLWFTIL